MMFIAPTDEPEPLFGQNHDPVPMLNLDDPHKEHIPINDTFEYEHQPESGDPLHFVPNASSCESNAAHHFAPFRERSHFNFADWLIRASVPKWAIDELFSKDMPLAPSLRQSFKSAYTLGERIKEMGGGLRCMGERHHGYGLEQ